MRSQMTQATSKTDLTLGDYRESPCQICGKPISESVLNIGSNKYPVLAWVPEEHETADCITYLRERIDALETARQKVNP